MLDIIAETLGTLIELTVALAALIAGLGLDEM
jgi:hypothetical protein